MTTLRQRAAFDIDCPEAQIEATDLPGEAAGVSGCGRRATYVEHCDRGGWGSRLNCTWVLNSAPGATAPAAAAQ
ncbi:hypothetical protein [Sandaracinus amylolyticus]|uniref:hypothetical protein n=1 Tax=Sandaracinus amylolyticus TaxID=927083 RepID=UPI001F1DD22A|nr:hypothetical protein [Sandaracinus amylolyticus]